MDFYKLWSRISETRRKTYQANPILYKAFADVNFKYALFGQCLEPSGVGIAEFERDMIRKRGFAETMERRVYKGRPRTYGATHKGLQHALSRVENRIQNKMTINEICVDILPTTKVGGIHARDKDSVATATLAPLTPWINPGVCRDRRVLDHYENQQVYFVYSHAKS